jgi:hypothetical protein
MPVPKYRVNKEYCILLRRLDQVFEIYLGHAYRGDFEEAKKRIDL